MSTMPPSGRGGGRGSISQMADENARVYFERERIARLKAQEAANPSSDSQPVTEPALPEESAAGKPAAAEGTVPDAGTEPAPVTVAEPRRNGGKGD